MKQVHKKQAIRISAWALAAAAVVAAPITASAASDTDNTVINATINAVISMTTASPVAISLTPTSGGVLSSASDTVTVDTNNSAGYELTLADANADTDLISGGNTIDTNADAPAAASALAGTEWGWAIATGTTGAGANTFDASYSAESNVSGSTTKWAGMPATGSAFKIKDTASTASGDTTAVWYAVRATTAQVSGVYTDTVTYTATTN